MSLKTAENAAIEQLAGLAHELTGIQLTQKHRDMIQARLQKRLSELGLSDLTAYVAYFHAHRTSESAKLVGLLTTHHTYFFREFAHFEFMIEKALPALLSTLQARPDRTLKVWSAACSRGQEVYSLAMALDLHLKRLDPTLKFEILGTDVDQESVDFAANGVYAFEELKSAPLAMLGQHWARGTGDISAFVKAKTSLRAHCKFAAANLNSLPKNISATKFDLIFCRNVFIYFNQDQTLAITNDLLSRLDAKGYLFIGISESLLHFQAKLATPVATEGPSVYRHKTAAQAPARTATAKTPTDTRPAAPSIVAAVAPKILRVLCVDDSPVILKLLGQILTAEHGFEVVGTALNGLEAAEKMRTLKPDVMTLDIHMPLQTGIEYLEKNFGAHHPPVVMVTSVTRETGDLAGRALSLGAADYVEKPALSNLQERGEEIRAKLRCARPSTAPARERLQLDQSFQKLAQGSADKNITFLLLPLSKRGDCKTVIREMSPNDGPCVIFVEGAGGSLESMADVLSKEFARKVRYAANVPATWTSADFWLMDFTSSGQTAFQSASASRAVSVLVFGECSRAACDRVRSFSGAQIVLEDLGNGRGCEGLMSAASDVVLSTSFVYLARDFFGRAAASRKLKAA